MSNLLSVDRSALEEARRLYAAAKGEPLKDASLPDLPTAPTTVEETGLRLSFLVELAVKLMFLRGNMTGRQLCDEMAVPYPGVGEEVMRVLKEDRLAAVRAGQSVNELDWEFYVTDHGGAWARDLMVRNGYAGPAPVPLEDYVAVAGEQLPDWARLNRDQIREALAGLVVSDEMVMKLGPAFNSGRSMFLYGNAGNGKTLVSEKMSASMRGGILLPHAIEAGGHVVQVYDPAHHEMIGCSADPHVVSTFDRRWVIIKRPFIIVGGELLMPHLEMAWDEQHRHYVAPLQLKANGGVFMIDDFGRQQVPVRDLLNRWVVPLEKQYDYHLLSGGVQLQVPFNLLIIFSTNLAPKDLVEEAFLRRIRYKIEIIDPTERQFREIFENYCGHVGLEFRPKMLDYLIDRHYRRENRGFRATHPRDLISQLMDIARFNELRVELTPELIDAAVATYFVDLG